MAQLSNGIYNLHPVRALTGYISLPDISHQICDFCSNCNIQLHQQVTMHAIQLITGINCTCGLCHAEFELRKINEVIRASLGVSQNTFKSACYHKTIKRCFSFHLLHHQKWSFFQFHRWRLKVRRDNTGQSLDFVYCNTISMIDVCYINILRGILAERALFTRHRLGSLLNNVQLCIYTLSFYLLELYCSLGINIFNKSVTVFCKKQLLMGCALFSSTELR